MNGFTVYTIVPETCLQYPCRHCNFLFVTIVTRESKAEQRHIIWSKLCIASCHSWSSNSLWETTEEKISTKERYYYYYSYCIELSIAMAGVGFCRVIFLALSFVPDVSSSLFSSFLPYLALDSLKQWGLWMYGHLFPLGCGPSSCITPALRPLSKERTFLHTNINANA